MNPKHLNELSHELIGAAIEVHRVLGPGLLESAYETTLCHELHSRGIPHERQKVVPILYKGLSLESGYRIDILGHNEIVIELKAVEKMQPIYSAQVLTYLRLAKLRLGLLINFNSHRLTEGIERIANSAPNLSAPSPQTNFYNP